MDDYLAMIKLFAGDYCPEGYLYCNGQLLDVQQNVALFSILGNQYGGDGLKTFALPNLNKTSIIPNTSMKYVICIQGPYPSRS